jgi:two-component system C4-dicarboxylate transport sensor histidine kinase DctB
VHESGGRLTAGNGDNGAVFPDLPIDLEAHG